MGTWVSNCQQKAESGISSHQKGNRIALLATINSFRAAPSRARRFAAASANESDEAPARGIENAAVLGPAAVMVLADRTAARALEVCVWTLVDSASLSINLVLNNVRSMTVKLSSVQS